jgi:VWFA-related protein
MGFRMITYEWRTSGPEPAKMTAGWRYAWLLLVFLPFMANGQAASGTQSAPATAVPATTVSAQIDEVSLDMVVHDKKHKLVLDLKPEEVAVADNGTPVTLSGFHLVNGDLTNGHLVTLVFDHFNGPAAKSAQNVAGKILKVLPIKGYSLALFDFTGRLRLLQGFTGDRSAVEQAARIVTEKADTERASAAAQAEKNLIAIAQTGADPSGTHVDMKVRAQYRTLLAALADAQRIRQDQHTLPTLAGLLALVRSQQQLAERKSIIYFTQNTQMDTAAKAMVHTITGAANQAGVSFYVVDMNALDVGGQYQIDSAMASVNANFNPTPQPVQGSQGHATTLPSEEATPGGSNNVTAIATDFNRQGGHPFSEVKSPLSELAANTGGGYIDAQNNLKKPLQQMVQDMTTYYRASYSPPIKEYDGSFRTITVKPLRAGLDVKTKTGYFALAPSAENGIRPFEAPLLKILSQPQLPTELLFYPAVLQFGELPDGNTSTVAIDVPVSQLETTKDTHTDLYLAHVSIVAQIKDESGTVIEHFAEDISRRGALGSIDRDKSAAITMQRHFLAIPGKYVMEAAVLDQLSGKASAVRIPFEIPPVKSGPSLSQLVLVRKVDAYHEEDDPMEPMRYEKGKVTPNLSGRLPQDASSVSLFFILHPDPKIPTPATLEIEVDRNGNPGRRTPLPLPVRDSAAAGAIPYMANFHATSLAPGVYQVKAFLTQGETNAEQDLSFTVPGSAARNASASAGGASPADGKLEAITGDLHAATQLVITSLTNPMPAPTPEEIRVMIEDARKRAVSYADSLPNFLCVEVTDRSFDPSGEGRWRHRDTIAELMRYFDKGETRTVLEVDGKAPSSAEHEALAGPLSLGEFGGVLHAVFDPSHKADFQWKETDTLGNGTVQVFRYSVDKENSNFSVRGASGEEPIVGFHGQVFIDSATGGIRRISMVTEDLPKDFPVRATSVSVDYDYVVINAHDYLMPIAAEVRLRKKNREEDLNTIEFRNYRRFSSNMKILNFTPLDK